jgi:hypothetical protein
MSTGSGIVRMRASAWVLHVFIDTNVYLTFFSFSEDDLEELRKLAEAIDKDDVKLWTTEHVKVELRRNRETKVAESFEALRGLKPAQAMPQMAKNLPEFGEFTEARREFGRKLNALTEELTKQFEEGTLAADGVLAELMDAAEVIPITDEILEAARLRVDTGNPPGKRGSLGDALNWEALLAACEDGKDLFLVTGDSDFVSKTNRERISIFLAEEWREEKSSEIKLYRRISSLFQDELPDIELAREREKETRIRDLVESVNFQATHDAIRALKTYGDFSDQQVRELVEGGMLNSQIRWIARDDDVQQFFRSLVDGRRELFDEEELARFERIFGDEEETPDDESGDELDLPF